MKADYLVGQWVEQLAALMVAYLVVVKVEYSALN